MICYAVQLFHFLIFIRTKLVIKMVVTCSFMFIVPIICKVLYVGLLVVFRLWCGGPLGLTSSSFCCPHSCVHVSCGPFLSVVNCAGKGFT
jgi:hypothetical protein